MMNTRRLLAADPCSLLNSLLSDAFRCAIAQRRHEIAEIILQALEAHAEETGDETALDAAYLQGIRSVTTPLPGSIGKNRRRPWRLQS